MSGPSLLKEPLHFDPYIYPFLEEKRLPKMSQTVLGKEFLMVFSERRSIKELEGCSLEQLSAILYYAVKPFIIGMDDYGVSVYRSATPSAGGRHPIDVMVVLTENGEKQLFLYQPLSHSLRRLDIPIEKQRKFISDVEQTLPIGESVLLWFSVQYMRTASKYSDYLSLVWRDVGAQLCCLQQAAKYVGIDSCPIGYLAEDSFYGLFMSDKLFSGGGMIVGRRKL